VCVWGGAVKISDTCLSVVQSARGGCTEGANRRLAMPRSARPARSRRIDSSVGPKYSGRTDGGFIETLPAGWPDAARWERHSIADLRPDRQTRLHRPQLTNSHQRRMTATADQETPTSPACPSKTGRQRPVPQLGIVMPINPARHHEFNSNPLELQEICIRKTGS
jgi:hypothetical protein